MLAWPKVRFAGEAVAVVVATDRGLADDAAELVEVDLRAAAGGGRRRRRPWTEPTAGAVVHCAAPDNVLLRRRFEGGDVDAALAAAARRDRAGLPHQPPGRRAPRGPGGGGVVGRRPTARLTLWTGTQIPHLARHALAVLLGMAERRIRVVAPDVGGGFGVQGVALPGGGGAVPAGAATRPAGEVGGDRARAPGRRPPRPGPPYRVTAGFDADGRLAALDADAVCNAGAYSVVPVDGGARAAHGRRAPARPLPGGALPLRRPRRGHQHRAGRAVPGRGPARPPCSSWSGSSTSPPPGLGLDPVEIRRRNLISPEDIPYRAATRLVHDSGTYGTVPRAGAQTPRLRRVPGRAGRRPRPRAGSSASGFAVYNELTGHGPGGLGRAPHGVPDRPRGGDRAARPAAAASPCWPAHRRRGRAWRPPSPRSWPTTLGRAPTTTSTCASATPPPAGSGSAPSPPGRGSSAAAPVQRAAEAVREKVLRIAAHLLEAAPGDLEHRRRRGAGRRRPGPGGVGGRRGPGRLPRGPPAARRRGTGPRGHPLLRPGAGHLRRRRPGRGGRGRPRDRRGDAAALRLRRGRRPRHPPRDRRGPGRRGHRPGHRRRPVRAPRLRRRRPAPHRHAGRLPDAVGGGAARASSSTTSRIPADTATGARGVGEGGTLGAAAALANAVSDALGIEVNELPLSPAAVFWAIARAGSTAPRPGPWPGSPGRSGRSR